MRPEAVAAMEPFLQGRFGNPSGGHAVARAAKTALEEAREEVAALLGARPAEIVFTAGGTEADNLAVKGAARRGRSVPPAVRAPSGRPMPWSPLRSSTRASWPRATGSRPRAFASKR